MNILVKKQRSKILFIIHDVYQDDNFFPAGIGYLSSVLMEAGCDVEIYAMDVFHYTNEELSVHLNSHDYDLICCGFMAARFKETILDLSGVINFHKKKAWFVLGGHGPSPIPEYILRKTGADIVAIGEAESIILDLIASKTGDRDLSKVKGIAYRQGENIHVNQRHMPILRLDKLPLPAWDIFPMKQYTTCLKFPGMKEGDKAFPILSSRGCVNRCNFCYRMEKGIRQRSVENIVQEMKLLNETYGITYFFFIDELFVSSKAKVKKFAAALRKSGLNVLLSIESRVDVFDEEIADILKSVGCVFVNIGFESTSQKVLDKIKKNVTVEQNYRAAAIAKSKGIGIGLNCLWGEPGDDEFSLNSNVEFILKYNLYDQIRTIRPVTPYPGCDLYYEAIEKGLLTGPEDFFEKFVNSDLLTVNFTDIPNERFYELLLHANSLLILDHFRNTSNNMQEAFNLTEKFRKLYAGKITYFRGARSDITIDHKRNL